MNSSPHLFSRYVRPMHLPPVRPYLLPADTCATDMIALRVFPIFVEAMVKHGSNKVVMERVVDALHYVIWNHQTNIAAAKAAGIVVLLERAGREPGSTDTTRKHPEWLGLESARTVLTNMGEESGSPDAILRPDCSPDFTQEEVTIGGVVDGNPGLVERGGTNTRNRRRARNKMTLPALVEAGGVGTAVTRGPDWFEGDQDGGEDGGEDRVGTVVGYLDEDGKVRV